MNGSSIWLKLVVLASAMNAGAALAECPFMNDYLQVRKEAQTAAPQSAAALFERYAATHENRESCELVDIDHHLGEIERALFALTVGSDVLPPAEVYRCDRVDRQTARCEGPMEDGTAHPMTFGLRGIDQTQRGRFSISTQQKSAVVVGVYSTNIDDVLNGRPAHELVNKGRGYPLSGSLDGRLIIAIFRTSGLWHFRKAVWYVDQVRE